MTLPTSLDHIVRESRGLVANLRRRFPDPDDFDRHVKEVLLRTLREYDYSPRTIKIAMNAIFGGY
jgi:hypothetical protein